jgi:hypothetical protein
MRRLVRYGLRRQPEAFCLLRKLVLSHRVNELYELLCFLQLSETENMTRNKGIATIENSQALWKYTVRQSTKLAR